MWDAPPLSAATPAAQFHLVPRYGNYASYPRLNVGTPACYVGGMNWPVSSALWVGEKPQVRVPAGTAQLRDWSRTPNGFDASLSVSDHTRVRFNQNFARGFMSDQGTPVDDQGLLALDVPAGDHKLQIRYRPPELLASVAISGIGLLLALYLLLRRERSAHSAPATPSNAATPARAGSVP